MAVARTQGLAESARGIDRAIGMLQLVERVVRIAPRDHHRVVGFKVRDGLVEVDLVKVVAVEVGNTEFLSWEDHRRAIDRAVNGVADEGLPGILIVVFVVRDSVEQDKALTVGRAPQVEHVAVVISRGGRLAREDDVFVKNIEVAIRAISDGAAVERLGHEDKAPLVAAGYVDDVFPRLRRDALSEVAAQAVDPARIEGVTRGRIAVGWRAVAIGAGRPALAQPVRRILREILPDTLGDAIESPVPSRGVVVEPIGFTRPVVVV